ncbi:hypothetical protein NQ317_013988 [Molorchus minor]|uniref:Uncharacterized protein n=1 Tax=Molorchus minor TaxID=1323400 RepID=A0ABQ9JHW2_9CUCU|nr:hypothetical protein NQ317_013988 [Molorchus minor]
METAEKYKTKFLEVYHPGLQGSDKNRDMEPHKFRKVHEDPDIDLEDKVKYLVQATVPGSRARQLTAGENYKKIVESLTSRFGREDLQVEVYIRELLKLILNNVLSDKKIELLTLYDKLETQLRALKTLGVTTDKCVYCCYCYSAAMLFPLVESCLPEDLLRVWQRSHRSLSTSQSNLESVEPTVEMRLKNLMRFLQKEVENEQRITLAAEGFGLKSATTATESVRSIWYTQEKKGIS